MLQNDKTIKVSCNAENCGFVGIYAHTTKKLITDHRQLMSCIQIMGDECPHDDVTLTKVEN